MLLPFQFRWSRTGLGFFDDRQLLCRCVEDPVGEILVHEEIRRSTVRVVWVVDRCCRRVCWWTLQVLWCVHSVKVAVYREAGQVHTTTSATGTATSSTA